MNFDMSPYGAFVWPAYGISVLVLGGMILWTVLSWYSAKTKLAVLEKTPRGAQEK